MTEKELLDKVVNDECKQIAALYSLRQILEQIESQEYNAEMLLRHLLLHIKNLQ